MQYEKEVRARLVDLLNRHLYTILAGNFTVGAAIVLVFWNHVPRTQLLAWSILLLAVILLRAAVASRYRSDANRQEKPALWGWRFTLTTSLTGVVWAFASLWFYLPEKPELVLFIGCMYAGLISGATMSTSAHLPAFYGFVIPAIVPFAIRNLLEGGNVYLPMGITILVYLAVSIIFARNINHSMTELNRLQLENQDLVHDLERQKQVAEDSRRVAENAMQEKSRFLAAASHDLRQPLHASGLLLGALSDHVSDAEGAAILEKVTASNQALTHLFNRLLDVSRLDAGVVEFLPRHFYVDRLLASLESEYQLEAQEKGRSLIISHDYEAVYSDPVLLNRVLRNLVTNAITHADQGAVRIECRRHGEDAVQIEVSDQGPGIPDNETELIFSEYYQIDNPERDRSKGLGLGLAIVKRLCELMGVRIEVQSEPGVITRFILTLPAGDSACILQDASAIAEEGLKDNVIMVIDDDRDVLEGMHKQLGKWGCKVVLAESAEQAIEAINQYSTVPDMVVADYRLRENRTGIEAVQNVFEEINREIPAVIITGDTSPERLREVKKSGFRILHKPVEPTELRIVMQQELGVSSSQ